MVEKEERCNAVKRLYMGSGRVCCALRDAHSALSSLAFPISHH